jgi:peptidoglycan/xylan/chitin deacetylase (PgdA/CDA1 family)
MKKKFVFIRNDDVRHVIEPELEMLLDIVERQKVPVSFAVEPENVSSEVIDYLLQRKHEHPALIELIQHGLNHNVHNQHPDGIEFGGLRDYQSQLNDMKKGLSLMNEIFGDRWCKVISFPYGSYNSATLQVVEELKYRAVTTSISYTLKSKAKDLIGTTLNKQLLLGKKVSYHGKIRKSFSYWDIGVSVNLIEKYQTYDTATHYNFDALLKMVACSANHSDIIGILLHHRYHKKADMNVFERLVLSLKEQGYVFLTLASVIDMLETH